MGNYLYRSENIKGISGHDNSGSSGRKLNINKERNSFFTSYNI